MTRALLVFLLLLPFATGLLGAVMGLLDRTEVPATLRRIAWRGLPFVVAGGLFGSAAGPPALAAVAAALMLHLGAAGALRGAMRRGWMTDRATPWWDE